MADYTATICCPVAKDRIYRAITLEMSNWWADMSSPFRKIGDTAKTDFGVESYWVFKAVTLKDSNLVELECCESHMVSDGLQNPKEWLGTVLRYEITEESASSTQVTFTHIGLKPEIECYEICKKGWDHYFLVSFKNYLDSLTSVQKHSVGENT